MFGNRIVATAFANRYADSAMQNINIHPDYGSSIDKTFISNLRYFLCDRIPDGGSVYLCELRSEPYRSVEESAKERFDYDIKHNENRIMVYQFQNADYRNAMAKIIEESGSFREIKNVEQYYRKSFPARCFVDDERKISVIITRRLNVHYYHMLSQSVPVILPWYFEGYKPSETDLELLKALQEDTDEHYLKMLEEKASQFDFKGTFTRNALEGYERNFDAKRISSVKRDIENIKNYISDYEKALAERVRQLRNKEIELFGYENYAQNIEQNELQKFMLVNKDFELLVANESGLMFGVRTYITSWDEHDYEVISGNNGSALISGFPCSVAKAKRLLDYIFDKQEIRVRTSGVFRANLDEPHNSDAVQKGYSEIGDTFTEENRATYIPNPHLNEYGCMGGYRSPFREHVSKYELLSALEICRRSAQTINFKDTAVMRHVGHYFSSGSKAFETPDGTIMNFEEINAWIDEREGITNGEGD